MHMQTLGLNIPLLRCVSICAGVARFVASIATFLTRTGPGLSISHLWHRSPARPDAPSTVSLTTPSRRRCKGNCKCEYIYAPFRGKENISRPRGPAMEVFSRQCAEAMVLKRTVRTRPLWHRRHPGTQRNGPHCASLPVRFWAGTCLECLLGSHCASLYIVGAVVL